MSIVFMMSCIELGTNPASRKIRRLTEMEVVIIRVAESKEEADDMDNG